MPRFHLGILLLRNNNKMAIVIYSVLHCIQHFSTAISRGAESNSLHIGKLDEHATKTGISTTKNIFGRKEGI